MQASNGVVFPQFLKGRDPFPVGLRIVETAAISITKKHGESNAVTRSLKGKEGAAIFQYNHCKCQDLKKKNITN